MCEHLGISALTEKSLKGDDHSATKEDLLFCNYAPDLKISQFSLPTAVILRLP